VPAALILAKSFTTEAIVEQVPSCEKPHIGSRADYIVSSSDPFGEHAKNTGLLSSAPHKGQRCSFMDWRARIRALALLCA
jgi:hypothetical protein